MDNIKEGVVIVTSKGWICPNKSTLGLYDATRKRAIFALKDKLQKVLIKPLIFENIEADNARNVLKDFVTMGEVPAFKKYLIVEGRENEVQNVR